MARVKGRQTCEQTVVRAAADAESVRGQTTRLRATIQQASWVNQFPVDEATFKHYPRYCSKKTVDEERRASVEKEII